MFCLATNFVLRVHDVATDSTDQVYGWLGGLGRESPFQGILLVRRMLPPRHAASTSQYNIVRAVNMTNTGESGAGYDWVY